jgi:hypothetical protein
MVEDKFNPEEQEGPGNLSKWDELKDSQDLESLWGISHTRYPVSTFGFIPLSGNHAVQGPVSNAAPSSLWGKRVPKESEKYTNFRVDKFRAMAGDYWDQLHYVDYKVFNFYHTSPLMSRPKEGSSRRIILDISWPKENGASIN